MIKNESNDDLTNVIVTYYSIGKQYPLPDISAKSSYKSSIDYTNHNEQSTYISYTKAGQRYKVLGSGYHAVYTKKPYKVIIK